MFPSKRKFTQNFLIMFLFYFLSITICAANSMEKLEELNINNTKQWVYITGTKEDNPILLVLHGGPGFAMLPLFHKRLPALEQYFTVVNWDQRGAGRSYSKSIAVKSLTLAQSVDDAHQITQYLKTKFNQKRIYVLGHSVGSMIGVTLVKQYPDDYHAYIGVGQVLNIADNEIESYNFALRTALEQKNTDAILELKAIGTPDKDGEYESDSAYDVTLKWIEYFGGSLYQRSNLDPIYDLIFYSDIYINYKHQLLKGYEFCWHLYDDRVMNRFNLVKMLKGSTVPVYLIMGKYDYETPTELIRKSFPSIEVSHKEYIEFNNSSHFPFYEEPDRFISVMKSIL
jgi:pimeloyl-ACP methyl ester carboxylesterase